MKYLDNPVSEESELTAGLMGFEVHENTFNGVPSVQPHHMWAMTLRPDSPARRPSDRKHHSTDLKPSKR